MGEKDVDVLWIMPKPKVLQWTVMLMWRKEYSIVKCSLASTNFYFAHMVCAAHVTLVVRWHFEMT